MANTKDVVIYSIGMLFQQIVVFAIGIIIARMLGPNDYGILSVTRNIYGVVSILAPLGLDLALLKHLGSNNDNHSKAMAEVNRLRLYTLGVNISLVFVAYFVIAPLVTKYVYDYKDIGYFLVITFFALPFASETAIMTAVFHSRDKAYLQSIIGLYIQPAVRAISVILLLWLGYGISGTIIATMIGYFVAVAFFWVFIKGMNKHDNIKKYVLSKIEKIELRKFLGQSIWMAAALLAYGIQRNVDILILAKFRPAAEVGVYSALIAISQIIQVYPQALSQTLGPRIARKYSENDIDGIKKELDNYLRNACLIVGPIFGGIAVFAPWLDLLFGNKYIFTNNLAFILGLSFAISATMAPMGYSLSMTGRHKREFFVILSGTISLIILSFLLAPNYGSIGVASAVVISFSAINIVRFIIVAITYSFVPGNLVDVIPAIVAIAILWPFKFIADKYLPHEFYICTAIVFVAFALLLMIIYLIILSENERNWVNSKISSIKSKLIRRK